MANKFQLKRTSVPGRVPSAADIDVGELAIQLTDNRLFTKTGSNTVIDVFGQSLNTSANVSFNDISLTGNLSATTLTGNLDWSYIHSKPDLKIDITGDAVGNATFTDLGNGSINVALSNTAVTPGTYGNSSVVPVITVDSKGRITSATTNTISGVTSFAYEASNNTLTIGTNGGSFTANINSFTSTSISNANLTGNVSISTIVANGSVGTSGQILVSNSTGIYWKDPGFAVQLTNSTANVSTLTNITTLQFDEDSGFDVVNAAAGVAKIAINSTFKYWEIDGTPQITAQGLDTINFISGSGITITGSNTATKSLTIATTGLAPTASPTLTGDVTITGNLIVTGTTTYVNTNIFQVSDEIITLNADHSGSPTSNVGFEVNRGSSANVGLIWNESTDKWQFTNDGSTYYNIPTQAGTNAFSTIAVSGSNSVVADTTSDTLRIVAGNNIVVTTDSVNKSITIESKLSSTNGAIVEFNTVITANTDTTYYAANSLSTQSTLVAINGLMQYGNYTFSGNSVSFSEGVNPNDSISIIKLDNSAGTPFSTIRTFVSDANTSYVLPSSVKTETTLLFVNGLLQRNTIDYTVSGNTVSFVSVPPTSSNVVVYTARSEFKRGVATGLAGTMRYALTDPPTERLTLIFINGLLQRPTTDYTFDGSDVVFNWIPPLDSTIVAVHFETPQGQILKQSLTADGSNSYTLDVSTTADDILVYVSGLYQHPGEDYHITGGTSLEFYELVSAGLPIRIRYINT